MPASAPQPFSTLLRSCRERARLTQEELAERAGLSVDAIGLLERGARQRPQRETVQRLAQALALTDAERAQFAASARMPTSIASPLPAVSLPVPMTPFVGRAAEIDALACLLERPAPCLVTLTGPGGVGKTRLALAVAARIASRYPGGVTFVPLVSLRDPADVLPAIAAALDVRERAEQSLTGRIAARLRCRAVLVVFDNFEHLIAAAPLVAELLAACPRLTALVTSRAPLHLSGERQFPVPPLDIPDTAHLPPLATLATLPSVALFTQRAQAVAPAFALSAANAAAVAGICRHLEGLPLALELGAAWVKTLPPRALLTRLERRLPLLTGGAVDAPARHRSMRDAIAWSHDLLPRWEQTLLHRLSVFVGGWTLEAAEAVCVTDGDMPSAVLSGLATLADASLIVPVPTDPNDDRGPRFTMLQTIREYAAERLAASGETEAMAQRHTRYFLALARETAPHLSGARTTASLRLLETEHDNLRTALGWMREHGEHEMLLRMSAALWRFWQGRGHLREGRAWLEMALMYRPDDADAMDALAFALTGAGMLAYRQGDLDCAAAYFAECLTLARFLGSPLRIADALNALGNVMVERHLFSEARAYYTEALAHFRTLDRPWGIATVLTNFGKVAFRQGQYRQAIALLEESLQVQESVRDEYMQGTTLLHLGASLAGIGAYARARTKLIECLTMRQRLGDQEGIVGALVRLGDLALAMNDTDEATALYEESLTISAPIGLAYYQGCAMQGMGDISRALGDWRDAATWYARAAKELRHLNTPAVFRELAAHVALLAHQQGRHAQVVRLLGAIAAATPPDDASPSPTNNALLAAARAALDADAYTAAWEDGRSHALDDAMQLALADGGDTRSATMIGAFII